MVITTRKFDKDTDTGFILDTMPKAIYFDSHPRRGRPSPKWFKDFHDYLTTLLTTADILIAASDDDPNLILGYAISDKRTLEFVYVKEAYRKQGIATMLAKELSYGDVSEKNMTKLGRKIIEQAKQPLENQVEKKTENKPTEVSEDRFESLIASGFPIDFIRFQSAILSGHNQAESQLSMNSGNKVRKADSIHYTAFGVVIKQNGTRFIVPLSNVIQAGDVVKG